MGVFSSFYILNKMKINWRKHLLTLHRDIGFLASGILIIYAVSGFLLNNNDGKNPSYTYLKGSVILEKISEDISVLKQQMLEANDALIVKKIIDKGDFYQIYFRGGEGELIKSSRKLDYGVYKRKPVLYWFNKLHYNQVAGWGLIADITVFGLLFLVLSGMFIVRGKKGLRGRGMIYLLIGIAIPIIYVYLAK